MTSLTRREFNTLTLSAAALAALGPAGRARARRAPDVPSSATLFDWRPTVGSCSVAFGQGGNALVVFGQKEAMLVDCKHPGLGATLRREAEALGSPIRLVVNTHHHGDHSGGNPAFTKDTPLIAHANATPRLIKQAEEMLGRAERILKGIESGEKPAPPRAIDEIKAFIDSIGSVKAEAFAPSRVVNQRLESDKFAGVEVQYHHVSAGHTDNDLIIFFPSLNLVHMGDLLFHNNWPFIDRDAGADTFGWQDSLREALALCDDKTTVIPGHGEITDRTGIEKQIGFFTKIREAVRHAAKVEGMTREEVVKLEPGAFKDYGLTQIRERTLGGVYDELEQLRWERVR
jgi:glyoxylase-like metal-dependent hydrolase (beta-lactamase superfamily II)